MELSENPAEKSANQPVQKKPETETKITIAKTLSFVIEFGFIIVLPLLIFGFLGKWLEAKTGSRIYLMAGLLLALITSSAWCYRRIFQIYKEFTK